MEQCFPLDNVGYNANQMRIWHVGRTSGVINATGQDYLTKSGAGMQIIVGEGYAYVQTGTQTCGGVIHTNLEDKAISVEPADALLDRYDALIIRYSQLENDCKLVLVKGTNSSQPTKYKPRRTADTYEIVLKYIYVKHGISKITNDLIQDAINDEFLCGLTVDMLTKIPTQQYDAQIKAWQDLATAEFRAWFETIKDVLNGDVGAKLAARVADVESRLSKLEDKVNKMPSFFNGQAEKPSPDLGKDGDFYFQIVKEV